MNSFVSPKALHPSLQVVFFRALMLVLSLIVPTSVFAAFGLTESSTAYTVDSGAGLVFQVNKSNGDVISIVFNGTEYKSTGGKFSQIASGLGTPTTVTAETDTTSYVKIACQTGPTNGVVSSLTQYLMVRNGENKIYMATYTTAEPVVGELRWITRLNAALIPHGPLPSDNSGSTGAIESSDVFGHPDGTTTSKYYGDPLTHGKDRAMDLNYYGATGPGIGCWMVFGTRESSSGGPFFRDIENQNGGDQEIYNYMNSGHNQTEATRVNNVLHGPYALVFTTGAPPTLPLDYSWIGSLNLNGWVPASGRGTVSGAATGIPAAFQGVVGFANSTAQYWAVVNNGSYTCPGIKPGTYTATLYKGELAVDTDTVTVTAGATTALDLASAEPKPSTIFRIGEWDGTPAGFLNADKIVQMHPQDVRMSPWDLTTFTVGQSDASTFPAIQFRGKNSPTTIVFTLAPNQIVDLTVRIGITCAYNSGRPQITVNGFTSAAPGASSQPSSRSFTIGTYRGNNTLFTYTIPATALVAGTNTMTINPISGSTDLGTWLSAGWAYDAVELDGPIATPTISYLGSNPLVLSGTSESLRNITVTLDGAIVAGTTVASGSGVWSLTYSSPLSPGSHTVSAAASDNAGNLSPASAPLTFNTGITMPVIASALGDTGTYANGASTSDRVFMFAGTAGAGDNVSINRIGTGLVGTVIADGTGNWNFDYTTVSLPDGANSFYATSSNGSGTSGSSSIFTLNLAGAPRVSIVRQVPATEIVTTSVGSVVFRVTLNATVLGVTTDAFSLVTTASAAGNITSVSANSGTVFYVTVSGLSGSGSLHLNLKSANGILDSHGQPESGYTAGETYTLVNPTIGNGTWIQPASGHLWSDPANWQSAVIADGAASTADFSTVNLTANNTVHLDTPRTLAGLIFGDTDVTTPGSWLLDNDGSAANTLALAGATPTITVNALGTGATTTISAALTGTGGLNKAGLGTLNLTANNALTGTLNVNAGIVQLMPGSSLNLGSGPANTGLNTHLNVEGGSFTTTGLVSAVGPVVVDSGLATLGSFRTNADFGALLLVNGGVLNIGDVNIRRNSGAPADFTSGFVVTGSGVVTATTIGLGTQNSTGAMSIEGNASVTATGPITIGNQATAARGGAMRVLNTATFTSTDTTQGIVMGRTNGTNANNVTSATFTGGLSTVEKFTLGFDSTVNAGSATITINGGSLYLGSGGIIKNGTTGLVTTITLTSGILGAKADWSSALNMTLSSGSTISLKAASSVDVAHDIALSGVLSGAGGFTKIGDGMLTLSGANTFTGPAVLNLGTLNVTGSLAAGGAFTVNSGGTLSGTGTINRTVTLNTDGTITPGGNGPGTLTATSLTWNGGGEVDFDLGTLSDQLVLTGALTKGTAGTFEFAFNAPTPPVPGTYTLATFGSTNFAASDFSYSGLGTTTGAFTVNAGSLQFTVAASATDAFSSWITPFNLPADQRGPSADPDGDGISNLLEFVLSLDPSVAGPNGLSTTTVNVAGTDYPAISFRRRHDLGTVTTEVRVSTTLDFSTTLGSVEVSATPNGDGTDQVIVRSTVPISAEPRQFLRLSATLP